MEHIKSIFGVGFLWSHHKRMYRKLAKDYNVSARLVYRLAHGLRPNSQKELSIIYELIGSGVMICS
ncbi:MAG: hypothetical protein MJY72_08470 [Bacteroidales bacterium]|nr:hypothetical protein [Bacteroidales bacterium]